MKWRTILAAAVAGALAAGHAVGGEAPKEVSINGKAATTGKLVARNSVGNPMGKDGEAGVARRAKRPSTARFRFPSTRTASASHKS